jgi:hypothetical protein
MAEKAGAEAGLSVRRALGKLECVTFLDHRKLYDEEGKARPIYELDDDTSGFQELDQTAVSDL